MSATPETDAEAIYPDSSLGKCVDADFARKLERERDEARKLSEQMFKERAEALREIHNQLVEYDELFDEAEKIRIERDSAKEHFKSIIEKANALIARWDQPSWKDTAPTAGFINALRNAVEAYEKTPK